MSATHATSVRLGVEGLEQRAVPAVVSKAVVGNELRVVTDDASTTVDIRPFPGWPDVLVLSDETGGAWAFAATGANAVTKIKVTCGSGGDAVANQTGLPMTASGGAGNDVLVGGGGGDTLFGGGGNDWLFGLGGSDGLAGDAGDDYLSGGDDHDHLYGREGNDRMSGGGGWDVMDGEAGHDALYGGAGGDWLFGGGGDDHLYGEGGGDWLVGDSGDDRLSGGADDDTIDARDWGDDDHIYSEPGDRDTIYVDRYRVFGVPVNWDYLEAGVNGLDTLVYQNY